MTDSLVKWKQKVSLFRDEADEDGLGPRDPRLTDTMQTPQFIMRDETNASAMKAMKMKQWWTK